MIRGGRLGADALLALVTGARCAACDRLLSHPTRGPVCASCWAAVPRLPASICCRCGLPLYGMTSVAPLLCGACRVDAPLLTSARAGGIYDGALRDIVHAFKYGGHRSLARPLAALMLEAATDAMSGVIAAVPVPLHRRRYRERGFNQARDLAEALGVPVIDALQRTRATFAQAGLPAARRRANVRGAFTPALADWPWQRQQRSITVDGALLLVDDVSTTGATLDECARVLMAMGAREVRAVTAARAVIGPR